MGLKKIFREKFNRQPTVFAAAPGRVNLLGEHTDYNDGFVLPMAIERKITLLGAPNGSDNIRLYSVDFAARDLFSLKEITKTKTNTWSNYIRGVCALFLQAGYSLEGMDIILQGDVPLGAGLSSSAALEVATALLVDGLNDLGKDTIELIKLAQRAENEFVGVNCGIMDQFVSMQGKKDHVLFLDTFSLDFRLIPARFAQLGYSIAVINSGVQRGLVDSEYNLRRRQCEMALNLLRQELPQITSLRMAKKEHLDLLPKTLAQRIRHVLTENERVLGGVRALRENDLQTFGDLLTASHTSLKEDFQVSSPELDLLVELTLSIPGTLGSKMTGAGFGGCIVSLTPTESLKLLKEEIPVKYKEKTGLTPAIYIFNPSEGAQAYKLEDTTV